ncbi:MAG TPA: C-GCAxxG-C-C family protein [Dehalococcoidales bacterium]|jgi:C_GCAxxG_C_C family probable redox protein
MKPKASKLNKAEKLTKELMDKYHNCAQCTLVAIQEISGLKDDGVAKASTGFVGGIGGTQSVCGALSGGVLALSLKYGRDVSYLNGPPEAALKKQAEAIEQAARLAKWFEKEFGTTICTGLRKSHMGTELSMGVPWQNEWANQLGMRQRCSEYAAKTARRVLAMLDDPNLSILEDI